MLQKLLLPRLFLFNAAGFVFLIWAWLQGWIQYLSDGDHTHIVWVCAGLFAVGLLSTFARALAINRLAHGQLDFYVSDKVILEKNAHLDDIAQWLVTLGLIGTVVGVSMSMGTIDISKMDSAASIQKAVSALFSHMHVAFNVTITGAVLALWTDVNRRILRTATVLSLEANE